MPKLQVRVCDAWGNVHHGHVWPNGRGWMPVWYDDGIVSHIRADSPLVEYGHRGKWYSKKEVDAFAALVMAARTPAHGSRA